MQNKEVVLKAPHFSQSLRFSRCLGGGVTVTQTASLHFPIRSLAQTNEWDDCKAEAGFHADQRPYAEPWVISLQPACISLLDYICYPENTQQCFRKKEKKRVQQKGNGLYLLGRERVATDWREFHKFSCWHRGYRIAMLKFLLGELGIHIRRFRSIVKWTLGFHMRLFWRSAFIASGPRQSSLSCIPEEDIYGRALVLKCQMVLIVSHAEEGSALDITHIISVSRWKWTRLEKYLLWP